MPLLPRLSSLCRNLFRKARKEQELTEEIDAYLEMLVEQKIKDGLNPEEARRAALIELGGREQVKEQVREVRMGRHLETLWQDVSYAARSLRKRALLSIIVIATLTLGIGVSSGVFAFYNADFLRPRLYKNHDSFARVYAAYTRDPMRPGRAGAATLEDYLAFRDGAKSLCNLAAYSEMLKGRQSVPGGGKGSWLYGLLIGSQVALSFFLLCGASLFVSVAQRAASFDPGFETRQALVAGLFVQRAGMELRNWDTLYRTLNNRITALPGVQSVAYSYRYLFSKGPWMADVQAPGQALRQAEINSVSSNYFTTLGIPIVSGRAIRENDPPCEKATGRTICAVVVSQRLAREFWPDGNPLGQTLRTPEGNTFEVVGVARDVSSVRLGGLDEPMIYRTLSLNSAYPPHPIVRFSGDEAPLARSITAAARELAPELVVEVRTIESRREELTGDIWRYTRLIVFLCAMAVGLALIGIYGVVAFAVSQRTKEMGIRIALGAQSMDIYRAVLGASGRPIAVGLLVGLAISIGAWSAMAPLLRDVEFAVNVLDPGVYARTAILLAGVSLAAMLIPARRATRVDPVMVLRDE
jgi:hypothetical protein